MANYSKYEVRELGMSNKNINKQNIESSFYRKAITINGKKIEKRFTRKSDAERWYSEKRREKELIENGLSLPTEQITVKEYSSKWLESRKLAGKPQSSWESDKTRLRKYILPQFGHRGLNQIPTKEWEFYMDSLVSDELIAPATRNRIRSLVTKMYNDALRAEIVANNPVRIIPKLKESMEAWDYWASVEDIYSYLEEAKKESDWFFNFACLSLNLGLRMGETIALDFEDVNFNQRRIHITKVFEEVSGQVFRRTKGHKERWLGINDSVFEALMEYRVRAKFSKTNDPIICDENGQRIRERKMRHIHDKVCERAKVKSIRPHDLRHTYASHYIMNGGSLVELQSLLGHSSPTMTLKYAHLAPGFLEKKAGIVSFAVPKQNVMQLRKIW